MPKPVSRPEGLPSLFFSLADALCAHLKRDAEAGCAVVLEPHHMFGTCFAAGINQRDWLENRIASNYILESLGFEPDSLDEPKQEFTKAAPCIQRAEGPGHVYILSNPSLPGLVKIGYTCQSVEVRVKQLSCSTASPTPFEVVRCFATPTPVAHEAQIHALLVESRKPGREFFSISEAEAISACRAVIGVTA